MHLTKTQKDYAAKLKAEGGPVPATEAFTRLRMSKLSIGHMLREGAIEKQILQGRVHYSLTPAGRSALPA